MAGTYTSAGRGLTWRIGGQARRNAGIAGAAGLGSGAVAVGGTSDASSSREAVICELWIEVLVVENDDM